MKNLPRMLLDLEVTRVDLVDEGANSEAFIKIFKRKEGGSVDMTFEEILKQLKPEHAQEVKEEIAKAKAEVPEATQIELDNLRNEVAKLKDTPAETNEEDILKKADPAVKALIEKSRLEAAAAKEAVKKMKEEQLQKEAIEKAKELPNIDQEEGQLAEVFRALKQTDEKLFETVFGLLKAANEAIAEGKVLEEIGKSAGTEDDAEAWNVIEKKAEEIVKIKNISKEAAIAQVVQNHPDLYEAYIKSME